MTRARTIAFWALTAALVLGHAIVAWHSLVVARFWEDEAFNLTVPLNLLAGLGYTSDGALSGSVLTPFDPRISTGPSVLLPVAAVLATGIDPVIGARLIPLAYWLLLLCGLAVLGHRMAGRWAALVAAAAPLAFHSALTISPIQGPADLLGEIPAAALLVWALVVLPRRAWLAGLLVGLAVQAKLIALLALPAFALALWVLSPGRGMVRLLTTLKRSLLPLALVGLPTLLVELAALITLGPTGFIGHLRELVRFVRQGGQNYAPTDVAEKVSTLLQAWYVPWWAALLVAVIAAALIVGGLMVARREKAGISMAVKVPLYAATVGFVTYIAWWSTAAHLPLWVRHPAPGIYAFLPILAAAAAWATATLWQVHTRPARVLTAGGMALLTLGLGVSGVQHVVSSTMPASETLAQQRAAAEPIRAWLDETGTTWLAAEPWGAAPVMIVLSGAHMGLFDAAAMRDVPRLTGLECATEVLLDGSRYRICAPPD